MAARATSCDAQTRQLSRGRKGPPEDVGGVSGYELILEDKSLITEMSRSKLRFTYKNEIYSAEGELVLPDDKTVEFVLPL